MSKTAIAVLALTILVGCSHLDKGMMASSDNPYADEPQLLQTGEKAYQSNCVRCHGVAGAGDGVDASAISATLPNFADGSYDKSLGLTAANIAYGKNQDMPAFKELMSEREIWAAASYVKGLSHDTSK